MEQHSPRSDASTPRESPQPECTTAAAATSEAEPSNSPAAAPRLISREGSAAANLRAALDERSQWVASTLAAAAATSPPRALPLAPGSQPPVPLRHVVARCLDEWGVESTDSDDDDDFCGWRVGSRAHPAAATRRSSGGGRAAPASSRASSSSNSKPERRGSASGAAAPMSAGRPPGFTAGSAGGERPASRGNCAVQ